MRRLALAAVLFATASLPAHALVLDYDTASPPVLNAQGRVDDAYGDLAGLVDATHRYVDPQGVESDGLLHWLTGYDDLSGTVWNGGPVGGDFGRITLASVNGSSVTLQGFDLGVWSSGSGNTETVSVYAVGNATPVFQQNFTENANQHWSFSVGATSTTGFVIEWTRPWWVALDNLSYTAAPVPEPGTVALMLLGLAGVVAAARRQA
jgi:hypothetical protein